MIKNTKDWLNILKWLIKEKQRCEQQSVFSTDPGNPRVLEDFILKKIKSGSYI